MTQNHLASGTAWLMASQFITIFSSYLIHAGLARWLGPETYGDFGVILSIIFVTKILFLTGITLGVSKYAAEKASSAIAIYKKGMKLQLAISFICLIIFLLFASTIANWLGDIELTRMIQFSSVVTFALGLYSVGAKGLLNGLHQFKTQAVLESILSLLRVIAAFLLVYLGLGLFGAVAAYVIAPLITFFITALIIQRYRNSETPAKAVDINHSSLLKIALPMTLFYLLFTLTTEFSLLAVKKFLADPQTGWYTAAITISKVVQSAFTALPLTILPTVSKAYSNQDLELVKKYLRQYLRYAALIIMPLAILISTHAKQIILLLYSSSYLEAAEPLQLLVFAFAGLALLLAQGSFLLGLNLSRSATVISLVAALSIAMFTFWLIPRYSLWGAALGTLVASMISLMVSSVYLWIKVKALIRLSSIVKIGLSSLFLYFGSQLIQFSGNWFVISAGLWFIVYFLLLIILKEIDESDWQRLRSVLRLRKDLS